MSQSIANYWLESCVSTVSQKDLAAHMNLISKNVSLQGITEIAEITYADWENQCRHEFNNDNIKQVSYDAIKMTSSTATHVLFKTMATVEANDRTINVQGIEVLLETEADGECRLIQERILSTDECRHDGLLN